MRDTQVGLKVFRREVADEVLPLLLVKQFAFDLELLAVSRALGFRRIEEHANHAAVPLHGFRRPLDRGARALVDTAAIFYRLRVLRYYQRKREYLGGAMLGRVQEYEPLVSVISPEDDPAQTVDYASLEVIRIGHDTPDDRVEAARRARGEILAFVPDGHRPAGNWISGSVPFFGGSPYVAAVVTAAVAPHESSARARAAAAVWESRLGGGALHYRFLPGNLRVVRDFPSANILVRRADFLAAATTHGDEDDQLIQRLAEAGRMTLYTPETFVIRTFPPLFRPHLTRAALYGVTRGRALRRKGVSALRLSTLLLLLAMVGLAAGVPLVLAGGHWRTTWLLGVATYVAALLLTAALTAVRLRSWTVGALVALGLPITHMAYAPALIRGFFSR